MNGLKYHTGQEDRAPKVAQQILQPVPVSNRFDALKTATNEASMSTDATDSHEEAVPARLDSHANSRNKRQAKIERRRARKMARRLLQKYEDLYFDNQIERAEDERTDMAKKGDSKWVSAASANHTILRLRPGVLQSAKNWGYATRTLLRRARLKLTTGKQRRVSFGNKKQVRLYSPHDIQP